MVPARDLQLRNASIKLKSRYTSAKIGERYMSSVYNSGCTILSRVIRIKLDFL